MKIRKNLFRLFSLLLLVSMMLVACGPAETEAPAATQPPAAATEPPAAATEPPAAATEAPADPMAALYEAAKAEGMGRTDSLDVMPVALLHGDLSHLR